MLCSCYRLFLEQPIGQFRNSKREPDQCVGVWQDSCDKCAKVAGLRCMAWESSSISGELTQGAEIIYVRFMHKHEFRLVDILKMLNS